jgi:large subunit ribosomal protein L5
MSTAKKPESKEAEVKKPAAKKPAAKKTEEKKAEAQHVEKAEVKAKTETKKVEHKEAGEKHHAAEPKAEHKASDKAEKKEHKEEHAAKAEHKEEHNAPSADKAEHKAAEKHEIKEPKKEEAKAHAQAPKAETKPKKAPAPVYIPRLRKLYETEIFKKLTELYKYSTPMAVPRLVKVIINCGTGDATQDKSVLDPVVEEMTLIAAQKAVKTYARKSISNFHLREGMPIGAKVNLRGSRMYDFLDKLVSVALPRVRDFKGLSPSSFDGRGNYTIGLKEQLVFPEIDYDKVKKVRGMDIVIVTTARNDDEALQLMKGLGFPFKEK